MRDINRIDAIVNELGIFWKKHPDLRFLQLIYNYIVTNDKGTQAFYYEDDELEKRLKRLNRQDEK